MEIHSFLHYTVWTMETWKLQLSKSHPRSPLTTTSQGYCQAAKTCISRFTSFLDKWYCDWTMVIGPVTCNSDIDKSWKDFCNLPMQRSWHCLNGRGVLGFNMEQWTTSAKSEVSVHSGDSKVLSVFPWISPSYISGFCFFVNMALTLAWLPCKN